MRREEVTLLTIDDETGLRHGIRDYFEDSGFKVLEAENGRVGLEIFRKTKPNVVLVDLRMPEIDGLEVIKTINKESPNTPVVVVSGTGVLADAIEAMRHGAWDYVTKPISDMVTLEHIVGRVLERAQLLLENKRYQQDLEKLVAQKTADLQLSMQKSKERGEAFKHLAKGLICLSGEDKFVKIVEASAAIFKTESAMLGLLGDDGRIVTVAFMVENTIVPSVSFTLQGTPCDEVVNSGHCLYQQGVLNVFPGATLLNELTTEGYIGISLKNRKGKILGVLGVFSRQPINLPDHAKELMDIIAASASATIEQERTDQAEKMLQKRLQQAQKMEAIGTLTGGIAHDFNNILSAILGYSELTLNDLPEGSQNRMNIESVVVAANRAADLVRHMLTFSRESEQNIGPMAIHLVVKEVLKLLRASIPTTIEIQQDIDSSAGIIQADPIQIHQVMMNLCTNATHAMEMQGGILEVRLGSVELTEKDLTLAPELTPGSYVKLSVRDTGAGIPSDLVYRIFDPFFTTKETSKGTGLGLSVVHGIVKKCGGMITVDSKIGQGTKFDVFFPKVTQKLKLKEFNDDLRPVGNERILIVDDEKHIVQLLAKMLERLGYQVTAKSSSMEALVLFRSDPTYFDLLITDQTMPEMTGEQLAKAVMDIRKDLPIILSTGYSSTIDEERATELGITAYVMKPVEQNVLAQLVRKVLDRNKKPNDHSI